MKYKQTLDVAEVLKVRNFWHSCRKSCISHYSPVLWLSSYRVRSYSMSLRLSAVRGTKYLLSRPVADVFVVDPATKKISSDKCLGPTKVAW